MVVMVVPEVEVAMFFLEAPVLIQPPMILKE
jgi:hypothetical protein